jgi:hypothetical protein
VSAWGEIGACAALGLAGSLHCAGMCGPLALALGLGAQARRVRWLDPAGYALGKSAAYSVLALALATGTARLASDGARVWLAWIAGLSMVLVALHGLGPWRVRRSALLAPLQRPLAQLLHSSQALPPPARALGLGFANGFLPCGLSWSAIALAATGEPATIALGPLAFGLASSPALAALILGGHALPLAWRVRGQRVAAALLLLFGLWTAARGAFPGASGAPCCPEPDGPPLSAVSSGR